MADNTFRKLVEQINLNECFTTLSDHATANDCFDRLQKMESQTICFDMGDRHGMDGMRKIPGLYRLPYDVCWFEGIGTSDEGRNFKIGMFCRNTDEFTQEVMIFLAYPIGHWSLRNCITISQKQDGLVCAAVLANELDREFANNSIGWLWAFLSALNCINVRRVKHEADAPLQKARCKRGKKPLFDTWTLELDLSKSDKKSADGGGTHSSPRIHLRRGHARQHIAGQWCWVQPHVVGNKQLGAISKNYSTKHPV